MIVLAVLSLSLSSVSAIAVNDTDLSIDDNSQLNEMKIDENTNVLTTNDDDVLNAGITPDVKISDNINSAESKNITKGTTVTINVQATADFNYHYDSKVATLFVNGNSIKTTNLLPYNYNDGDRRGSFDYTFSNDGTYNVKVVLAAYPGYSVSYNEATSNVITYVVGTGSGSGETTNPTVDNGTTPATPTDGSASLTIYDMAYPNNTTIYSNGDYVSDIAYNIVKSGDGFSDENLEVYINGQSVGRTTPNTHNRLGNLTFNEDNEWTLSIVYTASVNDKTITVTSNALTFITRNTSGGEANTTGDKTNATGNTTSGESNVTENSTTSETNTTGNNTDDETNQNTSGIELKIRDSIRTSENVITITQKENIIIQYYVTVPSGDLLVNEIIVMCNGEALTTISEPVSNTFTSVGGSVFLNETGDYVFTAQYKYYEFLGNGLYGDVNSNSLTYHVLISNETDEVSETLSIIIDDVEYPSKVIANVKSNVDGLYVVTVNTNSYDVTVSNGVGSVSFEMAAGTYTANIASKTNSNLKNSTTFTVKQSSVNPTDDSNKTDDANGTGENPVNPTDDSNKTDDTNGTGGNPVNPTDNTNGTSSGNNSGNSGTSPIDNTNGTGSNNSTGGNPVNPADNTNGTSHRDSSIEATDLTRGYNSPFDFKATFYDNKANPLKNTEVVFIINGNDYNIVTDEYGVAKIVNKLSTGTYEVSIFNPATSETVIRNVTIVDRLTDYKALTVDYTYSASYKIRLFADNGNPVGAGESVVITVNKVNYAAITDSEGYAILKIKNNNLVPKTYTVTATYKGVKVSSKLVVKQILKSKNKSFKKSAKTKKFTATLKTSSGKAIKGKKITFKIKGKTYSAKTNKKGVATIKVTNLKKVGKYSVKIKYLKNTIKKTIRIKK